MDLYKGSGTGVRGDPCSVKLNTVNDFNISAVVVDHGIDVLAYCVSMPASMAVSKKALDKLAIKPGPWISDLQKKASTGDLSGSLDVFGVQLNAETIASQILERRPGERFIYVTDMIFSHENLTRIQRLSNVQADLLICESNYVRADRDKAISKRHLTTYQAALIAAVIRAKKLQIFHVSNIYGGDLEPSQREAAEAFSDLQHKDAKELAAALSMECV
jgi:ribonuclease Z